MMDVSGAKVQGLGLMDRSSIECPDADLDNGAKSCEGCNTTETPLWRAGPSGPKSLCNACGIRYRKRRRDTRGSKGSRREETKMGVSLEVWEWGRDMVLKRRGAGASQEKQGSRRRMMMGEEEQAAVLLMALSSGLLYASR